MENEKLTICFIPWVLFYADDDYERIMREVKERGFNCIRIEYGASFLWDKDGNERTNVAVKSPFGEYTKFTTYRDLITEGEINPFERLMRVFLAAKNNNLKVILSSWFFLHTYWFFDESETKYIFDMTTDQKITFFADELDRILDVMKKENLIDIVAFVELFNEFDGIPFAGGYGNPLPAEDAEALRLIHEREIEKLRKRHPEVLYAYDSYSAYMQEELIPRNIDVFNFHSYYAWPLYKAFEKDVIQCSFEEPEFPPETRYYLKEETVKVSDVIKAMGGEVKNGLEWPRRICLYVSVDPEKETELEQMLEETFKRDIEQYRKRLKDSIENAVSVHDRLIPHSKMVMGEGPTYCASPTLKFEANSKTFWDLLKMQSELLKEKGLWGTVVRTTARPNDATWDVCKDLYAEVNEMFMS